MNIGERMPEGITVAYTLTGPGSGVVNVASANFTVELPRNSPITGTLAVTPQAIVGGFTPGSVNLTIAAPSATFTFTSASVGTTTISTTNNGGVINPRGLTYTVTP
jgi:hypothetical protein